MKAVGWYDQDLQMFVEPEHELDLERLVFLRWLAEQGRLEHNVAGPPVGEVAVLVKPRGLSSAAHVPAGSRTPVADA